MSYCIHYDIKAGYMVYYTNQKLYYTLWRLVKYVSI